MWSLSWSWRARGQGIIEYALIIALVVVVVLGTLILFGPQISSAFRTISNNLRKCLGSYRESVKLLTPGASGAEYRLS